MLSSLSHNKINMRSSLNSSTKWRLEYMSNCHILTYAKAFFQHYKTLKCIFMLHHHYYQIHKVILEEKCIIMELTNLDDIDRYDPK